MSKSTPTRPVEAQRPTNDWNPALDPQLNEPAAPPVETMYLIPALASAGRLEDAIFAPPTPAQFSFPHSPVANASVTVLWPAVVRSLARGTAVPDTLVCMALVFQFMLTLV